MKMHLTERAAERAAGQLREQLRGEGRREEAERVSTGRACCGRWTVAIESPRRRPMFAHVDTGSDVAAAGSGACTGCGGPLEPGSHGRCAGCEDRAEAAAS